MTAQVLGKPVRAGRLVRRLENARVEAAVERTSEGYVLKGTVIGRPGRLEIFRTPAPAIFLLNNWQSWGPMERVTPSTRFPELEAIVRDYSPYLFSPQPDLLLRGPVSDYFAAWEGTVTGFLTSRVGHPYFTLEGGDLVGWIDYFDAEFDAPVALEPLAVLSGGPVKGRSFAAEVDGGAPPAPAAVEWLLDVYGALVKRANHVRINSWNPVGWCSWYHYFGKLVWDDVLENLDIAARDRKSFPFDVFQIDDGYETDIGDWMSPKPGYPDLAGLARAIARKGFKAGIWTAPFSAAATSELFTKHPDWMVQEDGRPKLCYRGWGKPIYALDTTHPEVKAWLHDTFSKLRKAGFTYLKIDFLFAAAMPGTRRKRVTPVQAYREGLGVIRRAAGRDFILACGAPLLPSAGLVDGMRIGEDTAPYWKTKPSGFQGPNAYFALKNAMFRQFMHRKFWLNDPDCLLLRGRETELARNERELYALAAGAFDNMIIASDKLSLLGPEEKSLFLRALALRGGRSRVSGLLGEDAYVIHSQGGPSGDVRLGVNLSDGETVIGGISVAPRSGAFLESGRGNGDGE
ncbi:MAG: alpha-galactosidase [Candidatus Aminicenantes bacterium]|nr:alpha-galactosidase [Candidatus Aminicenantes bacterium]